MFFISLFIISLFGFIVFTIISFVLGIIIKILEFLEKKLNQ